MRTVRMAPMTNGTSNSTTVTTVYLSVPEGRVRRKVKEITDPQTGGSLGFAEDVHPKRKHLWREMDHYGTYGTGFVECRCGAIGIPYRLSRQAEKETA